MPISRLRRSREPNHMATAFDGLVYSLTTWFDGQSDTAAVNAAGFKAAADKMLADGDITPTEAFTGSFSQSFGDLKKYLLWLAIGAGIFLLLVYVIPLFRRR